MSPLYFFVYNFKAFLMRDAFWPFLSITLLPLAIGIACGLFAPTAKARSLAVPAWAAIFFGSFMVEGNFGAFMIFALPGGSLQTWQPEPLALVCILMGAALMVALSSLRQLRRAE